MAIFKNRKKYTVVQEENDNSTIKLTKMAKRELTITVVSIFAVLVVSMGSAFAVFTSFASSKDYNEVVVGTLKIKYTAENNEAGGYGDKINLSDAFPEDDATGKARNPYKFTITNEGTLPAEYTVSIKDDQEMIDEEQCEDLQLDKSKVKISIDGQEAKLLSELKDATGENYIIDSGNLGTGESKTYEIRMWISNDAGNEVLGKHFHGKIVIDGREYRDGLSAPDGSGANVPELGDRLIPVVYNTENQNWEVANISKVGEWYDYTKQKWANAVIVTPETYTTYQKATAGTQVNMDHILQMYVWIPRYSYTIQGTYGKESEIATTPGEIEVKFVNIDTRDTGSGTYPIGEATEWYTPDAFVLGGQNLAGIWVGKFETGYKDAVDTTGAEVDSSTPSQVIIKPDVFSWRNISVSNIYSTVKGIAGNDAFGMSEKTYDSHAMKNSEWGAVAYLSQSKYGKYGNNDYQGANKEVYINNFYNNSNDSYKTGCSGEQPSTSPSNVCTPYNNLDSTGNGAGQKGPGASTTGNIYGVYDMSGGSWEYVMGNYSNEVGQSKFTEGWNTEYKDYIDFYTSAAVKSHALSETSGWYGDSYGMINSTSPWLLRGGGYYGTKNAGVFYFYSDYGSNDASRSFRVVLTLK